MAKVSGFNNLVDPVDYLVSRKFPLCNPLTSLSDKKVQKYRTELSSLSQTEIYERYKEELKKEHLEKDQKRFFNQPDADADFDYWSKIPGWRVDEAVALTLGKNPKVVNKDSIQGIYDSPFVESYNQTREVISRCRTAGLLTDSSFVTSSDLILPHKFVNWAQKSNFDFPEVLAEKVLQVYEANKPPKTDFELTMQNLRSMNSERNKEGKGPLTQKAEEWVEKQKTQSHNTNKLKSKSAQTKEQETLLKLLLGLTMTNYTYDPLASRNSTAKEIADDLLLHGLSVDEDTVRKWLNKAKDFLPDDWKPKD